MWPEKNRRLLWAVLTPAAASLAGMMLTAADPRWLPWSVLGTAAAVLGGLRMGQMPLQTVPAPAPRPAPLQETADVPPERVLPESVEQLLGEFAEKVSHLTPAERNILTQYIQGKSMEEVAETSFISVYTVKKHNTSINHKLGITSRGELMLYIELFRRCGRLEEITDNCGHIAQ